MKIKIKQTGVINTYEIKVSGKDAPKTPKQAQFVFDALTEAIKRNEKIIADTCEKEIEFEYHNYGIKNK
jgi:hypothetical protein